MSFTLQDNPQARQVRSSLSILGVVDLNSNVILVDYTQFELVIELREFLRDYLRTCFFTNYYFEWNGQRINDFAEFKDLKIQQRMREENAENRSCGLPKLYMRTERYTEKRIRQHLVRFKEILTGDHCMLNYSLESFPLEAERGYMNWQQNKKVAQDKGEGQNQLSYQANHEQSSSKNQSDTDETSNWENHQDQIFIGDEFMLLRYLWGNNQWPKTMTGKQKGNGNPLQQLRKQPKFHLGQVPFKKIQTKTGGNSFTNLAQRQSMAESNCEASPSQIDMSSLVQRIEVQSYSSKDSIEDNSSPLMMLKLTLNNKDYSITATEGGFSYNSHQTQYHSYTLVGLLNQIDSNFSSKFEDYLRNLSNKDPYKILTQAHSQQQPRNWFSLLTSEKQLLAHHLYKTEDILSENTASTGIYGLDYRSGVPREWNDEYQQCKELPKATQMQRIQRKRTIQKVYQDFVQAATQGAMKVIEGNVFPLNPQDSQESQIFVYNNIFFSYCVDMADSFSETFMDTVPSFTAANADLKGIQRLEQLDFDELYTLATCIVSFMGKRVVCQSIIPGILSFVNQDSISEYGSSNNSKTIDTNEEYHKLMCKVASKLSLRVANIVEQSTKQVKLIAGTPEIKGVRGTDKRKYIIDLMRVHPRDANYIDSTTDAACVIRDTLIQAYQRHKSSERQNFKLREDQPRTLFNSNLLTQVPLESVQPNEMDNLKDLANFLKTEAIHTLISENLLISEGSPSDSETLTQMFHQHGVNMRYLGLVHAEFKRQCESQQMKFKHVEFLLEKEILVRSLKHVIIKYLSASSIEYIQAIIAHLFNCILSPHILIDMMDASMLKMTKEYITTQQDTLLRKFTSSSDQIPQQEQSLSPQPHQQKESQLPKKKKKHQKKKTKSKSQLPKEEELLHTEIPNTSSASSCQKSQSTDCDKSSIWSITSTPNDFSSRKDSRLSALSDLTVPAQMFFTYDVTIASQNIYYELMESQLPGFFNEVKPMDVFQEMKQIALARFNYTFEEQSFKELSVLQSTTNKYVVLRELCKALGVKIEATEYQLENSQNFCVNLTPSYEWLPIQSINILEFFPTVKKLEHDNSEVEYIISQANKAFKDELYELAFDQYAQCVSIYVQLQGPLQKEAFDCLQRMSRIIYLQGDIPVAIDLQTKAIMLAEALFGVDHAQTAHAMSTLALYYQQQQEYQKALDLLEQVLEIFTLVEGENHPDIASTFVTLGYLYQEVDHIYEAMDCFTNALYRFIDLLGEDTIQVSSCLSALAVVHFHLEDLRQALDYQERSHSILLTLQSKEPPQTPQNRLLSHYIDSSNQLVNYYASCCIQREKTIRLNQQHFESRQCKRALSRGSPILPPHVTLLDFLEFNKML